jgi:hypothetical protein
VPFSVSRIGADARCFGHFGHSAFAVCCIELHRFASKFWLTVKATAEIPDPSRARSGTEESSFVVARLAKLAAVARRL